MRILILVLVFFATELHAVEFHSGPKKVHLLELYTSQSCSSCPPAEAWLTKLKSSPKLWKDFVAVSFHVAYWNHLHWRDSFSKKEFSQRQRIYHHKIKGGVYTPQFLFNGADFRAWRSTNTTALFKTTENPGNLKVKLDPSFTTAEITFSSKETFKELICFGAYIENGHPTKVSSGENRGRNLYQDFVVIDLFQAKSSLREQTHSCELKVKINKAKIPQEQAFVFWLVDPLSYKVIQATGGKIPKATAKKLSAAPLKATRLPHLVF